VKVKDVNVQESHNVGKELKGAEPTVTSGEMPLMQICVENIKNNQEKGL
jgi:hypothetical protein